MIAPLKIPPFLKSKTFWAVLGAGSLVLAFAVFFAVKTRTLLDHAQAGIEAKLEKSLAGREVRLGRLTTNFVNAVSAGPCEVSNEGGFANGVYFSAREIRVQFKLVQFLRRHPLWGKREGDALARPESLAQIKLVRPVLRLERKDGLWQGPRSSRVQGLPLPPLQIEIEDGEISVADDRGTYDGLRLIRTAVFLDLKAEAPSFQFSAETPEEGKLRAEGTLEQAQTLRARVKAENIPSHSVLKRFLPKGASAPTTGRPLGQPRPETGAGRIALETDLSAPWPLQWPQRGLWTFAGRAELKDVSLPYRTGKKIRFASLSGGLALSDKKLETDHWVLKSSGSELNIEASLFSPLKDPRIEARVSGPLRLEEWLDEAAATADLSLVCRGPLSNPEGSARAVIARGVWKDLPLRGSLDVHYASHAFKVDGLQIFWGRSRLDARGVLSKNLLDFHAELKDLSLDALLKKKPFRAGGSLSVNLKAAGSPAKPDVAAAFGVKNFSLLNSAYGTLSGKGSVSAAGGRLSLSSRDGRSRLTAEVQNNSSHFRLQSLALKLATGESLKAAGTLEKNSHALDLSLKAGAVRTEILAPGLRLLKNFSGRLFLNGRLTGTLREPYLRSALVGPSLRLVKREGESGDFSVGTFKSDLIWSSETVRLDKISIGSAYKGRFAYWKKPARKLEVQATVADGNPRVLFALMNAPTDIEGKLNGQFSLTRRPFAGLGEGQSALEGNARLKCSSGHWSEIPFESLELDYVFLPQSLRIEKFLIRQKQGSLEAEAQGVQSAINNPLTLKGSAKNFSAAALKIDGDLTAEGTLTLDPLESLTLNAQSENLKINRFAAGRLTGTVEVGDKILEFKNLVWGDAFQGNGDIQFGQEGPPRISGHGSSSAKDLKAWAQIFGLEEPPFSGNATLYGKVSGPVSAMLFTLSSRFKDLRLLSPEPGEPAEKFEGEGSALYSGKVLKSLSLQLASPGGGALSVAGQADLKARKLDLTASFKSLDTAFFLQPFRSQILRGKCDGELLMKGGWDSPYVKGELRGQESTLGGIPMDSWTVAGTFSENELRVARGVFYGKKGSWRFSVLEDSRIKPRKASGAGTYRLAVDFANISLGPVFFVGNGEVEGLWEPSGDKGPPVFLTQVMVRECNANNYEMQPLALRLRLEDKKLKFLPADEKAEDAAGSRTRVSGEIDFSAPPCVGFRQFQVADARKRVFFLDGGVCMENPEFKMDGDGIEASLLSGILESPLTVSGKSAFKIRGETQDGQAVIRGDLSLENGKAEDVPLQKLESRFEWRGGLFKLSHFQARADNLYDLKAAGSFPLRRKTDPVPPGARMDFTFKITEGNLSLLNFFGSDLARNAKGVFTADIALRGKAENPKWDGSLEIKNGELGSRYLQDRAKNLDFKVRIKSSRAVVEKFNCDLGGSDLGLTGQTDVRLEQGEIFLDQYQLTLRTLGRKGIPLRVPELPAQQGKLGIPDSPSRGAPLFNLQLTGTRENPKISGWVEMTHTLFSWPPPKRQAGPSWLERIDWDVKVRAGRQTAFQNDYAYAKLNGELAFKGSRDDLAINGKITSQEGSITIYAAQFNLIDATLEVTQPSTFQLAGSSAAASGSRNIAYLQFKAEQNTTVASAQGTRIPETITLTLEKTPLTENFDSRKLTFRSSQDPTISSERVAARAGLGINIEALTPEERDLQMRQGIARLLDSQLASPIARTLLQRTGLVSKVEISQEANTGRTQEVRGTEKSSLDPLIGQTILLERTIGSRLGIGYKVAFDRIQEKADFVHQIQIRYPFYKGLWLYGSTELDSKENIGRDPERKGGIQWGTKFDFPDLFGSKEDKPKDK